MPNQLAEEKMSDQIPAPQKSGSSRGPVIVIVILVIICIVCVGCCLIAYLVPSVFETLLGPAIGNVFSNIIFEI
jgi:flagellar basal body-associated protein FliL